MSCAEYFNEQFQLRMLGFRHSSASEFYLSVCQKSHSRIPLLVIRAFLFVVIVAIICYSNVVNYNAGWFDFWFLYLTHWGLCTILLATSFGLLVSIIAFVLDDDMDDSGEDEDNPRWYAKVSWLFYNIASPLALFITMFYWSILHSRSKAPGGFALAFATHSVNSFVMLAMVFSSAVPSRILHVYQPCLFGLLWGCFSLVYYLAGGLNPMGKPWIYPVVDWSKPGRTIGVLLGAAVGIISMHCFVVALACLRDYLARKINTDDDDR